MNDNKQLMFCMSVDLTKSEALGFAQTMTTNEPYYIYKVSENPKARDWPKRESWVVCRPQRNGEIITGAYVLWVNPRRLVSIS